MAKRLIVSRNAYLHLDRIVEFNNFRNKSKTYSRKFLKSFFKEIDLLKQFPEMGMETSRENVYILIWNKYYIYYTVTDTIVEIVSVYHQKENVSR